MTFLEKYKKEIKYYFKRVKNIDDLVALFNRIQELESRDNPFWKYPEKRITEQAIKYYLYGKKERYKKFSIAKKSGGKRSIKAPDQFLKRVQQLLSYCFQSTFTPMPQATGFVPKRGIIDNAALHTGKKYVYNIDLKDFFPSISFVRVWSFLSKVEPFVLDNEIARVIANLCCDDGCLPQGAPTSPVLSNAICMRLDRRMYQFSKKLDFTYSRYADDITISCDRNIFNDEFREKIFAIVKGEGFEVNTKKERIQRYNVRDGKTLIRERQEVTGIVVNEKINVSRYYIRNLRAAIHNWEKAVEELGARKGYEKVTQQFEYYYLREKGHTRYGGKIPPFENYIAGKLEYLGMVRGKEDPTYQVLKLKFDSLCLSEEITPDGFIEILEIWQEKGIKKAMDKFYNRKNVGQENE